MIRRLIILLLIVGCVKESPTYGLGDGENNYFLQADYEYPLEIGNRWEYEIAYSGFEPLVGEGAGDVTGKIIVTIIDTVTLLDSINAFKFQHISYVIEPYYGQNDTDYFYGNNNEDAFAIYATSGYATNGFPRVENGLNGFSYHTIFDPFGSYSNIYNNDSDCNNSINYYFPEWERILYPINSDEEWIWFDENTNYKRICEDTDSTYVISQSNPPFSTVRSYGDTTTYTFDDQVYESFTINTEWQGISGEISAYEVYSNIGLMYQYLDLGEQIGMDEFGNPTDTWESFITVQLIDFQVLTADELIEPENDCDLHWSMCYYCDSNPSCPQLIDYADEHWDFGRWVHDYYKWYEYIEGNDDWNAIREIFINSSDSISGCSQDPTMGQCYTDIWDHSHRIEFTYDGSIMSSSSEEFKQVFRDLCGNNNIWDTGCSNDIVSLFDNNNDAISVIKDHHFYEGIGKYNMYTAGWDDNDSIYVITNDDGSKTPMTPHKLHYQGLYSNP